MERGSQDGVRGGMSAQVHSLYPGQQGADSLAPETAGELLRELRGLVMRGLGERLGRMFNGADDLLFDMSERAANNDQQRVYFDTMRAIRLGRARIAEQYETRIRESFDTLRAQVGGEQADPGEIDFENLALLESEDLEESIALSNMSGRAESAYQNALFELEKRLEWLGKHSPLQLPLTAIGPTGFCDAFRASLKVLEIEFSIKLVLYKLYERLVIGDLGPLYGEILGLFDRFGIHPEKKAAPRKPNPAMAGVGGAAAAAAAAASGLPPVGSPGPLPSLDEQTLGLLQQFGTQFPGLGGMVPGAGLGGAAMGPLGGAGGVGGAGGGYGNSSYAGAVLGNAYADAMLASELMSAARGQSVQGLDPGHAWAMTQRAGLVGRMFNEIVADPNLPRGVTGAMEDLRFPVIKTALSDVSFFSDPQHPVRSLINDLASMAASTRAGGAPAVQRFEELARKVKQQFDLNAETVRPKAREAAPLEESDIERFLDQQIAQGRERRQAIVEKVRKVVSQELELNTLTQPVPETLEPLLRSGWGPMMAMRLLRHGHDSELWRAGMELLHRVLFALNPKSPNARSAAEREALRRDIGVALAEVGMAEDRIDPLLSGLDQALDDVNHDAEEALKRQAREEAEAAELAVKKARAKAKGKTKDPDVHAEVPPPKAAPEPAPEPEPAASGERLLEQLLQIGSWFRVYDRSNHDTRWLKVTSWYPQTQRVSFAEFDGKNVLTLHTKDLYEDLISGRSEPIDSAPTTLNLLKTLREQSQPPASAAPAA
ncbi:hypothetical protein C3942_05935 [Solimonas fluminis]|uniref:DUF1631 domain-containing protein n=2 Tax=Solimonas fluminis TaxID=2086571 RepID=A0A2S5TJR3_9GAMM|nr:hypothetical protein C3942_05935 [Solimonas fluminis]